jgi:hypothetical protein
LATVVSVISGVVGLLFLFMPGLKPDEPVSKQPDQAPPKQSGRISRLKVDPDATHREFLARVYGKRALRGFTPKDLAIPGALLSFRVRITGFEGVALFYRWALFDEATGTLIAENRDRGIRPTANTVERVQYLFVPMRARPGTFFLVLELVRRTVQLDSKRTAPFSYPS